MHTNCSLCYTESVTNELICSFSLSWAQTSFCNGYQVISANNSLANHSIVRFTRQEHEQLEALLDEYFDASHVSHDEVGRHAEMECGKITMFMQ